jgi:hypothetical protein
MLGGVSMLGLTGPIKSGADLKEKDGLDQENMK